MQITDQINLTNIIPERLIQSNLLKPTNRACSSGLPPIGVDYDWTKLTQSMLTVLISQNTLDKKILQIDRFMDYQPVMIVSLGI